MILYTILFFIALCIGMAVSVYAFVTGGKRKKVFQDIYFSIENVDGIGVVYTKNGELCHPENGEPCTEVLRRRGQLL